MSSSSNNRPSSLADRRIANDNATARPRGPSGHQGGSRSERDPRRPPSPQASASSHAHRRATSSSQRTKGGVDERRTERVQVTTRETLTSRTKSPERRAAPQVQQQERARPSDIRTNSGDYRSKSSKTEPPQGMPVKMFHRTCLVSNSLSSSSMEPRGIVSTSYDGTSSISNIYTSPCLTGPAIVTASASPRAVFGGTGSCHFGGSTICFHGLRRPVHSICKEL